MEGKKERHALSFAQCAGLVQVLTLVSVLCVCVTPQLLSPGLWCEFWVWDGKERMWSRVLVGSRYSCTALVWSRCAAVHYSDFFFFPPLFGSVCVSGKDCLGHSLWSKRQQWLSPPLLPACPSTAAHTRRQGLAGASSGRKGFHSGGESRTWNCMC